MLQIALQEIFIKSYATITRAFLLKIDEYTQDYEVFYEHLLNPVSLCLGHNY